MIITASGDCIDQYIYIYIYIYVCVCDIYIYYFIISYYIISYYIILYYMYILYIIDSDWINQCVFEQLRRLRTAAQAAHLGWDWSSASGSPWQRSSSQSRWNSSLLLHPLGYLCIWIYIWGIYSQYMCFIYLSICTMYDIYNCTYIHVT